MKKGMVLFIVLLAIVPSVFSATIHGKVFDYSLRLASGSIVTINTVPEQRIVAADGTYSFTAPIGDYRIIALLNDEDTRLAYYVEDELSVVDDGDYVRDLILFPVQDLDELDIDDDVVAGMIPVNDSRSLSSMLFRLMMVLGVAVIVGVLVILFITGKKAKAGKPKPGMIVSADKKEKAPEDKPEDKFSEPKPEAIKEKDELAEVLAFIKEHKRVTQKEVRKAFPLSEAKISLIITDLESQGKVRKIKKGRGNVIIADES